MRFWTSLFFLMRQCPCLFVHLSFLFQGFEGLVESLDGQNRQSPIASDFGSRTQIAALFAILLYWNVLKRIANRAFRIAVSNRRDASDSNRAFLNR